jgi:outer membrane protein assembly factor BamB
MWERITGFFGIALGIVGIMLLLHPSMRGPAAIILTVPLGITLFAITAILCRNLLSFRRTTIALIAALLGFGFSGLLRYVEMWGDFTPVFAWRWTPTAEEALLTSQANRQSTGLQEISSETMAKSLANPEWPGFRGSDRTGRQSGSNLSTDWTKTPPKELWKIPVGPGWSSFVVAGDLLFTQEQRGAQECVSCYVASTGKEVWITDVESRFDDPLGGPGPRSTPTLSDGKLYAMGAEGWLQCLDPKNGEVVWKQDVREVAECKAPMWGFSSSPLIVDDLVVVYAGGSGDKGILAFDKLSGELVWSAATGEFSYASPQICSILDETLLVLLSNTGATFLDPTSGEERMDYDWKHDGYRSLQPQMINKELILIPTGNGTGTRSLRFFKADDGIQAAEEWTSMKLKPDFNDIVTYQDHIYGFDGLIFTCVETATGKRKWKGGRYGKGQVVLLEDQGLLVVASEKGEAILLSATPDSHQELAKFQAVEGKLWNHPVIVGNRLYIRNAEQAACYELPTMAQNN